MITENIGKLGFGLMRLPTKDGKIDIPQVAMMADEFLAAGFHYFDTAYVYGGGASEEALREAVVKRYPREKLLIASKMPPWDIIKTKEGMRGVFETSLARVGVDYFDFYLLHNTGGTRTKTFDDAGAWEYLADLKREGKIRHIGFSFHDKANVLDSLLTAHPEVEFVQLQINYADWESTEVESRKCYEVARRHGKPVVIMEPVKGGSLATLPDAAVDILRGEDEKASPASFAVRFAASLEGVMTVLSGMSELAQMEDNLSYMKAFRSLSDSERGAIDRVRAILDSIDSIPCTSCRYCVDGCPMKIAIPRVITALNNYKVYNNVRGTMSMYLRLTEKCGRASDCISCGACEAICPQHIKITDVMKEASKVFDK